MDELCGPHKAEYEPVPSSISSEWQSSLSAVDLGWWSKDLLGCQVPMPPRERAGAVGNSKVPSVKTLGSWGGGHPGTGGEGGGPLAE